MSSKAMKSPQVKSDEIVSQIMQKGLEEIIISTGTGLLLGGLAGLALSRGRASGARKIVAGLGGGIGLGVSWTKTSIELEKTLQSKWFFSNWNKKSQILNRKIIISLISIDADKGYQQISTVEKPSTELKWSENKQALFVFEPASACSFNPFKSYVVVRKC